MSEPGTKQPCVWTYDEYHDKWDTSCDNAFQTTTDTPSENGMQFCPFCQHPLQEQPAKEPQTD